MHSVPQILPPIGLIAELEDHVRETLSRAGRFEKKHAGDALASQGEPHRALSVILSGRASVTSCSGGHVLQLATLEPGDTVGEMNIIDPHRASADVVMSQPGLIWTISDTDFQNIVKADPLCAYSVLHWLGRQLCRRIRRNTDHMLRQAEDSRLHYRDMDY